MGVAACQNTEFPPIPLFRLDTVVSAQLEVGKCLPKKKKGGDMELTTFFDGSRFREDAAVVLERLSSQDNTRIGEDGSMLGADDAELSIIFMSTDP